jgi:type II secretory pathway pseudopilin PulG
MWEKSFMTTICRKRGNLFLGLLVLIVITGILATRLLPEYNTLQERAIEQEFAVTIGHIRAAMDIERAMLASSPCSTEFDALYADPTDPVKVNNYIKALENNNLLIHPDPMDPAIPRYRWGTGAGQLYWHVQKNLVASTTAMAMGSFEEWDDSSGINTPVGWNLGSLSPTQATYVNDSPSMENSNLDDYLGQNRFGDMAGYTGYALKLASSTP